MKSIKGKFLQILKKIGKERFEYILLGLILLLAFVLRVYRIEQPKEYYFDEVYHAYTARGYLNGKVEAYQFWADVPDEGVAYEWLHPPVAKFGMVAGMLIFGENGFGWRIGSVLAGVFVVLGIWALSKKLFKSRRLALIAALLVAIESMAITMSRIAMNDIYLVVFILGALYFYVCLRENLQVSPVDQKRIRINMGLTAVFTGLAVASKWTGFFLFVLYGIDWVVAFFVYRQRLKIDTSLSIGYLRSLFKSGVLTGVVSGLIYLVSYFQFFILGNTFDDLIKTIKQTWIYQTTLEATHPYRSVPSQWIVSAKPVYMYYGQAGEEWVSAIANVGNYAILIFGLVSVALMLYRLIRNFKWKYFFILTSYLVLFAPWILSPRIMFSYHYLPSSTLLVIPLAWLLVKLQKKTDEPYKYLILGVFWILTLSIFLILLPFNTGFPVSTKFFNKVYLPLVD